jgi:hypothetical protein
MNHPLASSAAALLATLLAAIIAPATAPAAPATIVSESFESSRVPSAAKPVNTTLATDTTRAHSGASSLRATPGKGYATVFFDLDGGLDFSKDCEFSFWVYAEKAGGISAYISANDGSSERYNVTNALGAVEAGKWCEFRGTAHAPDWRKWDSAFRLVIKLSAPCWIDDVVIRNTNSGPYPSEIWPRLESSLHTAANKRVSPLKPGDTLTLDARHAALAPDTATAGASPATPAPDGTILIPANALLTFAIDAKDDLNLTGTLELHHPTAPASLTSSATTDGAAAPPIENRESKIQNLHPGLRATVLADDTVIAAPGIKAAAWKGASGPGGRPGPAPDISGEPPPSTIPLAPFRLAKGRHYITIAGPHIRPAGAFAKLELRAAPRPAEKPLCTFGLFSDTHLGFGRSNWMNVKLNAGAAGELETALRQLKREGATFAILAGDMTDNGRRSQFEDLARVIKRADLPVYGCIGNHDTFRDSRKDIAATLPKLFPSGAETTDYAFTRPPLRFIVLDGSHWKGKNVPTQGFRGGSADQTTYREDIADWLRDTLAEDTTTPTIIISHYHMYLRRGVSPVTGYDLGNGEWMDKKIMTVLDAAPNVVATFNGHLHYNHVSARNGLTSIQNPAFVEWPNAYRVCRVYPDRLEWEVRQIPNRGLIREGVIPEKALLWMLSTHDNDLAGAIPLAPRKPAE